MKNYLLILLATLTLMGCKKSSGSKSAILEGRELPAISDSHEPTPTDVNFPELGSKK